MGPIQIMFSGKTFFDCMKKVDSTFAAALGSWLGCNRVLDPHFVRFNTLYLEIIMKWSELDWYGAPTNCVW
jgi:hypothetical protein